MIDASESLRWRRRWTFACLVHCVITAIFITLTLNTVSWLIIVLFVENLLSCIKNWNSTVKDYDDNFSTINSVIFAQKSFCRQMPKSWLKLKGGRSLTHSAYVIAQRKHYSHNCITVKWNYCPSKQYYKEKTIVVKERNTNRYRCKHIWANTKWTSLTTAVTDESVSILPRCWVNLKPTASLTF